MLVIGKEVDIDVTDADFIERYSDKIKDVEEQRKKLVEMKETLSPAEGIRQECKIIKDFLDYVIGEGTSNYLFNGKDSLNLCLNAFVDIIEGIDEQQREYNEKLNKYSPERIKR